MIYGAQQTIKLIRLCVFPEEGGAGGESLVSYLSAATGGRLPWQEGKVRRKERSRKVQVKRDEKKKKKSGEAQQLPAESNLLRLDRGRCWVAVLTHLHLAKEGGGCLSPRPEGGRGRSLTR